MKLIRDMFSLFTCILTGTVISSALYIQIYTPGAKMNTGELLWQIILEAAVCSLCIIFRYTKKEPSKRETIIRNIIIYIYVNIVVVGCAIKFDWFMSKDFSSVIFLIIEIAIVFLIIVVVTYYRYFKIANNLNQQLEEYKNRNKE